MTPLPLWGVMMLVGMLLTGCALTPLPPPAPKEEEKAVSSSRHFIHSTGVWLARQQAGVCTLDLRGPIDAAAVRQAREAFQWVEQTHCTQKTLYVNGRQGQLNEAVTLGAMVRNRQYQTALVSGSECGTVCMLVFAAGTQRWMAQQPAPAQIVLTQIPPDQDFGQRVCQTELSRGQQLTLLRYLRAMLPEPSALAVYRKLEAADCRTVGRYGPMQAQAMGLATGLR